MNPFGGRRCAWCGEAFHADQQILIEGPRSFCDARCSSKKYSADWLEAHWLNEQPSSLRLEEKFWSNVAKSHDPDGCWLWTGVKDAAGYGSLCWNGEALKAHRYGYELQCGPIPEGHHVRHFVCDTPSCVRGSHLRTGTHAQNMEDRNSKGRQSRGEHRPTAKLTEADVRSIRASVGESYAALAKRFGVSPTAVYLVMKRKAWRHVE